MKMSVDSMDVNNNISRNMVICVRRAGHEQGMGRI